MRILFMTRLFYPHVGGVEKHVLEISKRLIKKGHEITVLTTKFDTHLKDKDIVSGRISVIYFNQPKLKLIGLLYTWAWILKNIQLIKKSDIVHIHDVFIWYLPFRFLFLRKKIYTTFHGWEGEFPIPIRSIFQKRLAFRLSNATIAVGSYIKKYFGIKADEVVLGGVNIPRFKSKKKEKLIIYVGRLDKKTTLRIFLKILKRYHNFFQKYGIRVEFCGDGELREACEIYGKVHGWKNPEKLYSKARYVFASGYLTILEAFAHHCLVLVSYGLPIEKDIYFLTPFKEYIFCFKDPKKIVKIIKFYEIYHKKYLELTNKAFKWVRTQTWDELEKKYLNLWLN